MDHKAVTQPGVVLVAWAWALGACSGDPDPGNYSFRLLSPPAPLAPLEDPRVSALELRSLKNAAVLGRTPFVGGVSTKDGKALQLGQLPVGEVQDLQLLALGTAGQLVLGQAVTRDIEISYGARREVLFEVRRPLFFFGSQDPLANPPRTPPAALKDFVPNKQLYPLADLRDTAGPRLRVVDPNATNGVPLLSMFTRALGPAGDTKGLPVLSAAGTSDGVSLLAATGSASQVRLYVLDTNMVMPRPPGGFPLPAGQASPRSMALDARDQNLVMLGYELPTPTTGTVGTITFVRNLPQLRGQNATAVEAQVITLDASEQQPPQGPPLAAVFAPDGMVDVVLGPPPLTISAAMGKKPQPDCDVLAGSRFYLRRYDPRSGAPLGKATQLPYTTDLAYTSRGERVLVQPCEKAPGSVRPGRVLIERGGEADLQLPAPGTLAVAVAGRSAALVAIGRDSAADDAEGTTIARGTVRVLEPGQNQWATESSFPLDTWRQPYVINEGLPDGLDVLIAPRDLVVHQVVLTPDRTRALVAARAAYHTQFALDGSGTMECRLDWVGYTHHLFLVNLQTGAREQDWRVGMQVEQGDFNNYDISDPNKPRRTGYCGASLESFSLFLRGYMEGYIPAAVSVLFGQE